MALDIFLFLTSAGDTTLQAAATAEPLGRHWLEQLRELAIVYPDMEKGCIRQAPPCPDHENYKAGRPYMSVWLEFAYIRLCIALVILFPAWRERVFHMIFVYLAWWLISNEFMFYFDIWKNAQPCDLDSRAIQRIIAKSSDAMPTNCGQALAL